MFFRHYSIVLVSLCVLLFQSLPVTGTGDTNPGGQVPENHAGGKTQESTTIEKTQVIIAQEIIKQTVTNDTKTGEVTTTKEISIKLDVRLKIHTYKGRPCFKEDEKTFYYNLGVKQYFKVVTHNFTGDSFLNPPPISHKDIKSVGQHGAYEVFFFQSRHYYIVEKSPVYLPSNYKPHLLIPSQNRTLPLVLSHPHRRRCDGMLGLKTDDCNAAFFQLMVQNPISAGSHNLMKVAEHGSCRVSVACADNGSVNFLSAPFTDESYGVLVTRYERLSHKCCAKGRGGHTAFKGGCSLEVSSVVV